MSDYVHPRKWCINSALVCDVPHPRQNHRQIAQGIGAVWYQHVLVGCEKYREARFKYLNEVGYSYLWLGVGAGPGHHRLLPNLIFTSANFIIYFHKFYHFHQTYHITMWFIILLFIAYDITIDHIINFSGHRARCGTSRTCSRTRCSSWRRASARRASTLACAR